MEPYKDRALKLKMLIDSAKAPGEKEKIRAQYKRIKKLSSIRAKMSQIKNKRIK